MNPYVDALLCPLLCEYEETAVQTNRSFVLVFKRMSQCGCVVIRLDA